MLLSFHANLFTGHTSKMNWSQEKLSHIMISHTVSFGLRIAYMFGLRVILAKKVKRLYSKERSIWWSELQLNDECRFCVCM